MAVFDIQSQLMRKEYVYYKSLKDTHKKTYNKAVERIESIDTIYKSSDYINAAANELMRAGKEEALKEIRALNTIYKVNLNLNPEDLLSEQAYKTIATAFNSTLQTEEVFKRNYNRLVKYNQAKITIAQFFPQYFAKAFTEEWPRLNKLIAEQFGNDVDIADCVDKVLTDTEIENITRKAVEYLFTSAEMGRKKDEIRAYQVLLQELDKPMASGNTLLEEIMDAYEVNKFVANLKQTLKEEENTDINKKSYVTGLIRGGINRGRDTLKKGTLSELLITALQQSVADSKGIQLETAKVGQILAKADVISTYNLDLSEAYNTMAEVDKKQQSRRIQNIEAAEEIQKKLNQVKDGFIIYTNAKEYSLIRKVENSSKDSYYFDGFNTGEPIQLKYFSDIMKRKDAGRSLLFTTAILNTVLPNGQNRSGAIGCDGTLKEDLEGILSEELAFFLFDDFMSVGKPAENGAAIHMMYLSGFYIPLSYMLFLLGKAFEQVANQRKILSVHINPSKQIYDDDEGTIEKWNNQRDKALTSITIGAKFLSNIIDIVTKLM